MIRYIGMMLGWGTATAITFLIPGDQGYYVAFLFICLMPMGFLAGLGAERNR